MALPESTHIVRGVLTAPQVMGRHQWWVVLGGLRLTVEAISHQKAKEAAIKYWATCNGNPAHYETSIRARIAEKWRGGIRAKLIRRGPKE